MPLELVKPPDLPHQSRSPKWVGPVLGLSAIAALSAAFGLVLHAPEKPKESSELVRLLSPEQAKKLGATCVDLSAVEVSRNEYDFKVTLSSSGNADLGYAADFGNGDGLSQNLEGSLHAEFGSTFGPGQYTVRAYITPANQPDRGVTSDACAVSINVK